MMFTTWSGRLLLVVAIHHWSTTEGFSGLSSRAWTPFSTSKSHSSLPWSLSFSSPLPSNRQSCLFDSSPATEPSHEEVAVVTLEEDEEKEEATLEETTTTNAVSSHSSDQETQDSLIVSLKEEIKKLQEYWMERIQGATDALEQLQRDSSAKLASFQEQAQQKEQELLNELESLRSQFETFKAANQQKQTLIQELQSQKLDLEAELELMTNKYVQDVMDWEDRYEREQDLRKQHQVWSRDELRELRLQSEYELEEATKEWTRKEEETREGYLKELSAKDQLLKRREDQLLQSQEILEQQEEYIEQLETERSSIRKLARASWKLTQQRLGNLKNRILRRNNHDEEEEEDYVDSE